jgi:F-type H+-transporting ATPase subunit epsilon
MSMTIDVEIVSAEAKVYSGTAELVVIPALQGEIGVAPRHAPLLTQLKPGSVRILLQGKEEEIFYVQGGLVEIQPHLVSIMADTALRAEALDEAAALEVEKRSKRALMEPESDLAYSKALAELAQALAQLRTIQQLRKKLNIK